MGCEHKNETNNSIQLNLIASLKGIAYCYNFFSALKHNFE